MSEGKVTSVSSLMCVSGTCQAASYKEMPDGHFAIIEDKETGKVWTVLLRVLFVCLGYVFIREKV